MRQYAKKGMKKACTTYKVHEIRIMLTTIFLKCVIVAMTTVDRQLPYQPTSFGTQEYTQRCSCISILSLPYQRQLPLGNIH